VGARPPRCIGRALGRAQPGELDPLSSVFGWRLDDEAFHYVDEVLAACIHDPVGPSSWHRRSKRHRLRPPLREAA